LTALHSLQSSLDTLRKHRPAYAPRTGFIWPIVEKEDSPTAKKQNAIDAGESEQATKPATQNEDATAPPAKSGSIKKMQNNLPMFRAMTTTARHSSTVFAAQQAAREAETAKATRENAAPSDDPTPTRTSATPARGTTPAQAVKSEAPVASVDAKAEPVKGAPGQGKKKRKRGYICSSAIIEYADA
jgi:mediator of RNA polymerase II transcription subunit 6